MSLTPSHYYAVVSLQGTHFCNCELGNSHDEESAIEAAQIIRHRFVAGEGWKVELRHVTCSGRVVGF